MLTRWLQHVPTRFFGQNSIFAYFGPFLHSKNGRKLKSKSTDRLWVYNSEIFFGGSGHPYAPVIGPPKLQTKKVFFWDTLMHTPQPINVLFFRVPGYMFLVGSCMARSQINRGLVCFRLKTKSEISFLFFLSVFLKGNFFYKSVLSGKAKNNDNCGR